MKAESQASGVLGAILAETAERLGGRHGELAAWERRAAEAPEPPPFAAALRGRSVAVIAELKRRSPSAGALRADADARTRAGAYLAAGAAAVSVLTEPLRFGGSLEDLEQVAALGRPALRKDFIISELQLLEARAAGASAALLIVRALGPDRLRDLVAAADGIGVEALVEVHSEAELETALATGARIVGVNARDLETLEMDGGLAGRLLPRVPADVIAVAESGLAGRDDVALVAAAGADAVLVGSALMRAADPSALVRELAGVARRGRP